MDTLDSLLLGQLQGPSGAIADELVTLLQNTTICLLP